MFIKEDYNIQFYSLRKKDRSGILIRDTDNFEMRDILSALFQENDMIVVFDFIKSQLSFCTLEVSNKANNSKVKSLIERKCNEFLLDIQHIKKQNLVKLIRLSVLERYLEGLVIHLLKNNPKIDYIPENWINIESDYYTGSRPNRLDKPIRTDFVFVNTAVVYNTELVCKHIYELNAFLGLLFSSEFLKPFAKASAVVDTLNAGKLKVLGNTSAKEFIKDLGFNPTAHQKNVLRFFRVLLSFLKDKQISQTDEVNFQPNNKVSGEFYNLLDDIVRKFRRINQEDLATEYLYTFFIKEDQSNVYFQKEISYLIHKLEKAIDNLN